MEKISNKPTKTATGDLEVSSSAQATLYYRVTINWAGDELHLDLSEDSWRRVQAGKELTIEELDENDETTYRWLFNVAPTYSLIVDFGDPNHLRWLGQLTDAQITEVQG